MKKQTIKAKPTNTMKTKKTVYVIAGPNGAGKTTFALEFLPHFVRCLEFVNADYLATGISPLAPELAAIQAGRLMLARIKDLRRRGNSFGFETTLAGKSYVNLLKELKAEGYKIHLRFLWLPSANVAVERVAQRVRKGGHGIPSAVIRRRFKTGLRNLFSIYHPLLNSYEIWDAALNPPELIVAEDKEGIKVFNAKLYRKIIKGVGLK